MTQQEKFDSIYIQLVKVQDAHIANNERYWQGLPIPNYIPKTGDDPTIDTTVKPNDQDKSWNDKGITFPNPCDIQFKVDQWQDGKGNSGWELVAMYYTSNDKIKKKTKDHNGNETEWVNVDLSL